MNYRLLGKMLGMLLILLSITLGICLVFSWLDHERAPGLDAVDAFLISSIATLFSGIVLTYLGRGAGVEMLRKEAIAVVGVGWILCAEYGALPFALSEPRLGLADAFFESMSGFTTTGATVITDLTAIPHSINLWRCFTQWLGGLGILVLFVAVLSYLGVGSKAIFRHESSAKEGGGLQSRIHDVALMLWLIYLSLSIVCTLGLKLLGMSWFDAICHALTAISTGGFSPHNESVGFFNNVWIEIWLMIFMIIGGISFMLYAWFARGRWSRWRKEEETKVFLFLLLTVSLIIAAFLTLIGNELSFWHGLRVSSFQVISIITTTGFATDDFNMWPPFTHILLLLLMLIGGCAGSTAGGIKLSRWILFFKIVRIELVAVFRPNQVFRLQLNGNTADESLKLQTVFFVAIAAVTVVIGTALVSLMQPSLDKISCVSGVLACLFNIGPGLAKLGPTENFAFLEAPTKVFLSLLMALGRLEFFAVMVLFMPSLWKKY